MTDNAQINEWIAVEVMGWEPGETEYQWFDKDGNRTIDGQLFTPATNIEQAIEAADMIPGHIAMARNNHRESAEKYPLPGMNEPTENTWLVQIAYLLDDDKPNIMEHDVSLPRALSLAICRATGMPEG